MESGLAQECGRRAPRLLDVRPMGRPGKSKQLRVVFTFETPEACRLGRKAAWAWYRPAEGQELEAEAWRANQQDFRAETWWSYEVFYWAPLDWDGEEARALLEVEQARLAGVWPLPGIGTGATGSGLDNAARPGFDGTAGGAGAGAGTGGAGTGAWANYSGPHLRPGGPGAI